jgi:hypothetical protein
VRIDEVILGILFRSYSRHEFMCQYPREIVPDDWQAAVHRRLFLVGVIQVNMFGQRWPRNKHGASGGTSECAPD